MSDLCRTLSPEFTRAVRVKGDAYARAGRVQITRASADTLHAIVQGSRAYRVELETRVVDGEATITASCDCPFADQHLEACKHLWAALRVAEDAGHLADADAGLGRVYLEVLPAESADDEDLDRNEHGAGEAGWQWASPDSHRKLTPAARREMSEGMRRFWARRMAAGQPKSRPALGPGPGATLVSLLEGHLRERGASPASGFRYASAELIYVFVPPAAHAPQHMLLHVMTRARKKNGDWASPRPAVLSSTDILAAPEADRRILGPLAGAARAATMSYGLHDAAAEASFGMRGPLAGDLVPAIAATGRAFLRIVRPVAGARPHRNRFFYTPPPTETVWLPLAWDDGRPWRFAVSAAPADRGWSLHGSLVRPDAELALADIAAIDESFVWTQTTIARADVAASLPLVRQLIGGPVGIAPADTSRLGLALAGLGLETAHLPDALRVSSVDVAPLPVLRLSPAPTGAQPDRLDAALSFDYEGSIAPPGAAPTFFDEPRRRVVLRRSVDETAAADRLAALDCRPTWDAYERRLRYYVRARQLGALVSALLDAGWRVEGTTGAYRRPRALRMSVVSNIDWFDLDATVTFDDATASLGDVLAAITRREPTVRLDDGSIGLLADDWLRRYLPLAAAGEPVDGRLRFRSSQTALLDALLADAAAHAVVDLDEGFRRARDELARTGRIEAVDPPAGFVGTLRDYQREGLGWLQFLDRAGFGGCLADDMGLGKTVMVLAMLEARRGAGGRADGPSLAVVPRSLIHNWIDEARRFAPALKVLDFSTSGRSSGAGAFGDADLVLMTYGTLRRDVMRLKDESFDYVILDEAQAIKNADTAGAKAARVLRGRRRLALTGTPIENHLGELWSLFEFLNPGVLGRSSTFTRAAAGEADAEAIGRLARGLRPFILRRTKQQVARELPARTEQTITCELSKPERALYEKLRRHYRESVLARVDRDGMPRAQMHILEALLRLRQAACHPALVDRQRANESSAKLDVLVARLDELVREGHKALVFSQFTSLLALVRRQLDARGMTYEYLDGRTRDRRAKVTRFQEDPGCPLFLVSLKAGGVGLNLTAAEYVFLLDPWWNPAVEAQAIDRTHRIGQTREVFAYRLVAGGTIEEKILELQQRKRALADAILSAGGTALRHLDRADLDGLLS